MIIDAFILYFQENGNRDIQPSVKSHMDDTTSFHMNMDVSSIFNKGSLNIHITIDDGIWFG